MLGVRVNLLVAVEALHHLDHHDDDGPVFALDGGLASGFTSSTAPVTSFGL